jgi:hemolysin activation/secretion protein
MIFEINLTRPVLYVAVFVIMATFNVSADFFSMPEITEMPTMERKSLLKDLDIPSVRDRDPDPEAGPRLNIEKFKLEGIVEFPELGITRADIDELVEGIRFDLMKEYDVLESGFTKKELEEVSKLLVQIEEETQDRHVSDLEVQRLIWLVRDQRSKRGVTLGQIEAVADRITQFYRKRGFILAKAYIPKQKVRDGVVTLTLLLGLLGETKAHGNEMYDSGLITSLFDDWLGLPVTTDVIEENLYLINDLPGISVTGYFEPGGQVGDSLLNLNVRKEDRFEKNIRLDNYGSKQTGKYRIYGELKVNNLAGNADQLLVAGLYTLAPENSDYAQLRYSTRIFNPRLTLEMGGSSNDFVIGPGNSEAVNQLELSGETHQKDLLASYSFIRSRTISLYGKFKSEEIESILNVGVFGGDAGLDDIVQNNTLSFSFDILDEIDQKLHQGTIGLISGEFKEGAEIGQDEKYEILTIDYNQLAFWQPFFMDSRSRLVYRLAMQWTESPLSSINQFSLAGATRVRAYDSNQFSADAAIFMSVDWVLNSPEFMDFDFFGVNMKRVSHPFIFLDVGWGEAYSIVDDIDDNTGQLIGAGVGLQFTYLAAAQSNIQLAFPVDEDFSSSNMDINKDIKIIFDFQYRF